MFLLIPITLTKSEADVLSTLKQTSIYTKECFKYTIPYPEHTGPPALSSAGPYPSEPPLRLESGTTPHHQDYPTPVHGGRLEIGVLLLKVETKGRSKEQTN